jgi:tetratricopeptide (TPR) repeat protein
VRIFWVLGVLAAATAARADETVPKYGPPPAWVKAAPPETRKAPLPGAPAQALLLDQQASIKPEGEDIYAELKAKILAPEGLSLGNLDLAWDPQVETLTIHRVTITRDGQVRDVLANERFTVTRRERNLEQAMLDGRLTASLQVKGLQVGDVIDVAFTRTRRDPLLAGHPQFYAQLPTGSMEGRVRLRATWPQQTGVRAKASADLARPGPGEINYEFDGLAPVKPIEGAPARYNYVRTAEISGFADWSEVSGLMAPLYAGAATLRADSPLKAEAAKIRAATADPTQRMLQALALVQDQVRYVFVGLDSGAYRPAAADDTWARRFGDCKAKTALLIALLHELGLEAEPVLANSGGVDGLDQHLPRLDLFNHVLVRASVGGKTYWLDGTRLGDTNLADLATYPYGWALPVRAAGAKPQRYDKPPLVHPQSELILEIDNSQGLDAPAKLTLHAVERGDGAFLLNRSISSVPREQAERAFRKSFKDEYSWAEPGRVDWTYDPVRRVFTETLEATGKLDWEKDSNGRPLLWYEVENDGFGRIDPFVRPKEQDQSAPYAAVFPYFERWVTTVRLPKGKAIGIDTKDVNERLGAYRYVRRARVQDGTVVMYRAVRSFQPEISAAEAAEAEDRRAAFKPGAAWIRLSDPPRSEAPPPKDAEGLLVVSYDQARAGDHAKALASIDQALKAKPGWNLALGWRAEVLGMAGRYDEAAAIYVQLMALEKPPTESSMLGRAVALRLGGHDEAALQQVAAAAAAFPKSPRPLLEKAQALFDKGDHAQALAAVDAAIALDPQAYAHRIRAAVLWNLDRRDEALAAFEAALAADPDDPGLLVALGSAYSQVGRHADARAALDEALLTNPISASTLATLADAELRAGHPDAAIRSLDLALGKAPDSAALLNTRCWTRALIGRELDLAAKDCDAALQKSPKFAAAMDSRAFVSLRQGRYSDAIARYDAVLALRPDYAASLYARGIAKMKAGDAAGGQADLAKAKAKAPKVDEVYALSGVQPDAGQPSNPRTTSSTASP